MKHSLTWQAAAISLAVACLPAFAAQIDATDLYDLPPADVVILGEIHDNAVHHAHQAIAVGALGAKALVFEMLSEAQARRITPRLLGSEKALGAALGWQAGGWPEFSMYYPIFIAADAPAIFGGALDRDDVRRAVSDGAAAILGDSAGIFGLDVPLESAEQTIREAQQQEAHCGALPEAILPGMVQAQRLRDAAMARAVIAAIAENGGPVAVITGNGHARTDWGVPQALGVAAPDLTVLSVGQFEIAPSGDVPYDLWLVTDPAPRGDPCAAFQRR